MLSLFHCCGRSAFAFHFDLRDDAVDGDAVVDFGDVLAQNSVAERRHFDDGLVRLHFEDGFAALEAIAGLLEPSHDPAFFHGLPQAGERHVDQSAHAGLARATSQSAVSSMSRAFGTAALFQRG